MKLLELDLVGEVRQALVDPREIVQRDLQRLADAGQAIQRDRLLAALDLPDELAAEIARAAEALLAEAGCLPRSWRILVPTILRVFVIM